MINKKLIYNEKIKQEFEIFIKKYFSGDNSLFLSPEKPQSIEDVYKSNSLTRAFGVYRRMRMLESKTSYIKIWRTGNQDEPIIAYGLKDVQKDDMFQCVDNLVGGPVLFAKTDPVFVDGKVKIETDVCPF